MFSFGYLSAKLQKNSGISKCSAVFWRREWRKEHAPVRPDSRSAHASVAERGRTVLCKSLRKAWAFALFNTFVLPPSAETLPKLCRFREGEASILLMAFHYRFLRCLLMSVQETHTVLGQRVIMSRKEDCDIMAKGLSAHGRNRKKALPQRFGMLASLYNAHGFHSLADVVDTEDVCPLQK